MVLEPPRHECVTELPQADPDKLLTWQGWKEGALVKDDDTGLVYRYRRGKLLPDANFNRRKTPEWIRFGALMGACLAGALLLVFATRKRRATPGGGMGTD